MTSEKLFAELRSPACKYPRSLYIKQKHEPTKQEWFLIFFTNEEIEAGVLQHDPSNGLLQQCWELRRTGNLLFDSLRFSQAVDFPVGEEEKVEKP